MHNVKQSKKRKKEKFGDRPRGHGKGDANCCARRMTQPAGAGSSKAVPFSLIVSDPELFDCPICLEPLTIPVFQVICLSLGYIFSTSFFV